MQMLFCPLVYVYTSLPSYRICGNIELQEWGKKGVEINQTERKYILSIVEMFVCKRNKTLIAELYMCINVT